MESVEGKIAVVTGAASGIGLAMVERFLDEGMKVVMADVEEPALVAAAAQLRDNGGEVEAVQTDVSDPDAVDALAQIAVKRFGTFHVICNNAGVGGQLSRAWETPLEVYKWVIDVNLWGVIHGIRTFVPRLVDQDDGHIVNTASLSAWGATPFVGAYSATKHAVLGLTEGLQRDLADAEANVGVSIFCPGGVNTNILDSRRNWPTALGQEPSGPSDPASQAEEEALKTRTAGRVDPSVAADVVLEGILTNRFVLTTHPDQLRQLLAMRIESADSGVRQQ
jgi:NAD(P)-dependent dehydrogenase (short-subunit alcohol dehydrogenase family)